MNCFMHSFCGLHNLYLISMSLFVIQILGKEGFAGLDDVMKHIPGGVFSNVKAKSSKGNICCLAH